MGTLWQDIRYGVRMLGRNPGFTAIIVLILAVGIGATAAMLSVIDAVLLRPPPYEDPKSLVYLYSANTNGERRGGGATSFANYADWRSQSTVFEQVVGITHSGFMVATDTRRERVFGLAVSSEYFSLLRIEPALGRVFRPEEEEPGAAPVVVVSHRFWQDWLGGDPGVLGRTTVLDQKAYTVVGVLPAGFRPALTGDLSVYVPLVPFLGTWAEADRGGGFMYAMARLKPGVTVAQAQSEMSVIGHRLEQAYPAANAGTTVSVVPLTEEYSKKVGQSRRVFFAAQGIVTFVLLIACLHVASLLLIRSATREKEIAVRAALGARRLRLTRQLLTEGLLLALLGGALGLLLAYWAFGLISVLRSGPSSLYAADQVQKLIPWFIDLRLDAKTLLYVTGVSLLTCALFGVLPAVRASGIDLNRSLSTGRTLCHGRRLHTMRSTLVIVDVAIAFVLLIGAGLLVNSFARLNSGLGYEPAKVLVADIRLDGDQSSYSQPSQRLAFFEQVLDRLGRLPGVQSATAADSTPAWGGGNYAQFRIEGHSPPEYRSQDKEGFPLILRREVCPDYSRVLQIPLLKGRLFTDQDRAGAPPVILVNEVMAGRFWPDGNPVGKRIWQVREQQTKDSGMQLLSKEYEIVGVVGNVKHLAASDMRLGHPEAFVPYPQTEDCDGSMCVMVRTNSDPRGTVKALRSEVLAIDASVTIRSITPLEEEIAEYVSPQRFHMVSLGVFAVVALVLAAMGVYGITAYAVSQRTNEIGIRMALGAAGIDVLTIALRQGLKLTVLGLIVGLGGAIALTRVISSLLYDVTPTDPLTFACVSLLLGGVALLASYIPARRAARIDPMVALRCE